MRIKQLQFFFFLSLFFNNFLFAQSLLPFKDYNNKYGYKNINGKVVISPKYDYASSFENDIAIVGIAKYYGVVDTLGNEIVAVNNDNIHKNEKLLIVQKDSKYSILNYFGKEISNVQYDYITTFCFKYLIVSNGGIRDEDNVYGGGKWGVLDVNLKTIVPLKYSYIDEISEGTAVVKIGSSYKVLGDGIGKYVGGKSGFIDSSGKEIIKPIYEDANAFSEGFAAVKLNGKWGYINKFGSVVIPMKYKEVKSFGDGLAPVSLNKYFGYINKTGKVVIPFVYVFAEAFSNGKAYVELEGKGQFYINKKGEEIQ